MSKSNDLDALRPVIITKPQTVYESRQVTINRAPTDESVRLLREMEAKAEAQVIQAVRVDTTTFSCVVHKALDPMQDRVRWRAVFKLNGHKMQAEVDTNPRDGDVDSFRALRDEMAKVIAQQVLGEAFAALLRERFR